MPAALFQVDGAQLVPDPVTRGGWSDLAQHGSPPAGILARAVERVPTAAPMQVVRFTIDLFREVPIAPLTVTTEILREGRRIQLVRARLHHGSVEVGQAVALKIRTASFAELGELTGSAPVDDLPEPGPEELPILDWRDTFGSGIDVPRFHTDGVEIRTVDDSFVKPVAGHSWFRLLQPLVAGEAVTPFQRVATLSDLANGNAQALDPQRWLFVNPDITLYLHRLPESEWIGMKSEVQQEDSGIGMTDTVVYDLRGRIGRIVQAQLLDLRSPVS